jgi:cyclophilin family peptidyl-prolyl cis-trans isomerase
LPVHLLLSEVGLLTGALLLSALAPSAGARDLPDGLYAEITTPRGTLTCELELERAPLAVTSFVGLAEGTLGPSPRRPFFDGLTFHRVVPGFVIQGGDPLGTGEGGPGYTFPDEFGQGLGHESAGILSMANGGPDTNGSQFFITLAPAEHLDYMHTVFGRVVQGADVPARVVRGDSMRVRILRIGDVARHFRADDASFAALVARTPRFRGGVDSEPSAPFFDPDHLLPARDPPPAQRLNTKLRNFERAAGTRVYVRIYSRFAPKDTGTTPEAFAHGLSQALGLDESGVLAVYFADRGKWNLVVGKGSIGPFTGYSQSSQDLVAHGGLIKEVNILLTNSEKRRSRYTSRAVLLLPNFLQIPGEQTEVSVDAMVDELLSKISR